MNKLMTVFLCLCASMAKAQSSGASYTYFQDTGNFKNLRFAQIEKRIYDGLNADKIAMYFSGKSEAVVAPEDKLSVRQVKDYDYDIVKVHTIDDGLIWHYEITKTKESGGFILSPKYMIGDVSVPLFDIHANELRRYLGDSDFNYLYELFVNGKTELVSFKLMNFRLNAHMKNSPRYALSAIHEKARAGIINVYPDEFFEKQLTADAFSKLGKFDYVTIFDAEGNFSDTQIWNVVNPRDFLVCDLLYLHNYDNDVPGKGTIYAISPIEVNDYTERQERYYWIKMDDIKSRAPEYYMILDTFLRSSKSAYAFADNSNGEIPNNEAVKKEIWNAVSSGKLRFGSLMASDLNTLKYRLVSGYFPYDYEAVDRKINGVRADDTAKVVAMFNDSMLTGFSLYKEWSLTNKGLTYRNDSVGLFSATLYDSKYEVFKVAVADLSSTLSRPTFKAWQKLLKQADKIITEKDIILKSTYDSSTSKAFHYFQRGEEETYIINFKDDDWYDGTYTVTYMRFYSSNYDGDAVYIISAKKKRK